MGLFSNQAMMTVMGKGLQSMFLYKDGVGHAGEATNNKLQRKKWAEITSIAIEDGEALQKRVTATRLLALGVFALAAQKKSGGTKYITVEGEDFFWTIEVDRKNVRKAQQFVMKARSMKAKS